MRACMCLCMYMYGAVDDTVRVFLLFSIKVSCRPKTDECQAI